MFQNLQLLQRPKIPPAPKFDEDKTDKNSFADEHSDIVEQYRQKTSSG